MILSPLRTLPLAVLLVAAAALASSCSSDDEAGPSTSAATVTTAGATTADSQLSEGSGTGSFEDRTIIVNFTVASAGEAGVTLDSQCVLDIVAQLTDADAKEFADTVRAGALESPDLSPEGVALGEQLTQCGQSTATT